MFKKAKEKIATKIVDFVMKNTAIFMKKEP